MNYNFLWPFDSETYFSPQTANLSSINGSYEYSYTTKDFLISFWASEAGINEVVLFRLKRAMKMNAYSMELKLTLYAPKDKTQKGIPSEYEPFASRSVSFRDIENKFRVPIDFYFGSSGICVISVVFHSFSMCVLTSCQLFQFIGFRIGIFVREVFQAYDWKL